MKLLSIITTLIMSSFAFSSISLAQEVNYKTLSKSLVKVSKGISLAKVECGSDLRDVVEVQVMKGVTVYQFNLQKRGIGRLGENIYKSCKAKLKVDTRATWHDGAAVYTFKYIKNNQPK